MSYDLVIAKLVIRISSFQVLMFNSIDKDPVLHSSTPLFVSISRKWMISLFVHMQEVSCNNHFWHFCHFLVLQLLGCLYMPESKCYTFFISKFQIFNFVNWEIKFYELFQFEPYIYHYYSIPFLAVMEHEMVKLNNFMCTLWNIILWEMFLTHTWDTLLHTQYTQKPCELKLWLVSLETETCTLCVIGTP